MRSLSTWRWDLRRDVPNSKPPNIHRLCSKLGKRCVSEHWGLGNAVVFTQPQLGVALLPTRSDQNANEEIDGGKDSGGGWREGGRRTLVTSSSAFRSTPKSDWNTNGINGIDGDKLHAESDFLKLCWSLYIKWNFFQPCSQSSVSCSSLALWCTPAASLSSSPSAASSLS